MVHLIPSRIDYNAKEITELVFAEIYRHHGIPRNIVSDRDVLFTSNFWQHLNKLLGIKNKMSSAYHPETDGSTERANQTVTQMIRNCVAPNQQDWVSKIPGIEFAINLSRSESTRFSPFFLNTGRIPRSMIWNSPTDTKYLGVRKFAMYVKHAIMSAHDSIIAARVKQTQDANRRRRPAPFSKGDLVYISTKNLAMKKGLARKLAPKFIGPYPIIHDYSNNSFLIDLPGDLKKQGVHPVYHAQYLRIHIPNDDRLFPGRLDSQLGLTEVMDSEWKVDCIRSQVGQGTAAQFEIQWASGDVTWLKWPDAMDLVAMQDYFNLLGISGIQDLPTTDNNTESNNLQVSLEYVGLSCDEERHQGRSVKHKEKKREREKKRGMADFKAIDETGKGDCRRHGISASCQQTISQ